MRLIRRRIPEIRFFYKILAIVDKLLHHSVYIGKLNPKIEYFINTK